MLEEIHRGAKLAAKGRKQWLQTGFNPRRHAYFDSLRLDITDAKRRCKSGRDFVAADCENPA